VKLVNLEDIYTVLLNTCKCSGNVTVIKDNVRFSSLNIQLTVKSVTLYGITVPFINIIMSRYMYIQS